MTRDQIFYAYMTAAGLIAGAVLWQTPGYDYYVPPFFWILLAVAVFEVGGFLVNRTAVAGVLSVNARVIGFLIGVGLMLAVTLVTGTTVRFL